MGVAAAAAPRRARSSPASITAARRGFDGPAIAAPAGVSLVDRLVVDVGGGEGVGRQPLSANTPRLTEDGRGGVDRVRVMGTGARRASEWTIHGERVVDDTRRAVLSVADVELPDGVRFEQYVLRVPAAAMVIVLDDADRVLMMWRHRFVIDRWVWELPGGYLDPDEDPAVCAAREVEEETGWRPRSMQRLLAFQPMVGTIDQENIVYPGPRRRPHRRRRRTSTRPKDSTGSHSSDVERLIDAGEIVGAGSVAGLLAVLLPRPTGRL